MRKKERQAAIMRLISENEIETQNELKALLEREGIIVAQATLSRDMRELSIKKSVSDQNMVVLKCHAGLANAACKVVDEQEFGTVVGTIAGDDTVFIVTRSENHAVQLISQLARLSDKD